MEPTQSPTEQRPTDRDILISLVNLVGALAERMTGERLTVQVPFGDGQFISITPSIWTVTWVKPAADSTRVAPLAE